MRNLRSFEVEPWLKSAGQQVWTRIRRGLLTQEQELQERLQHEVEQLRTVRTNVQRATQLARVLDAVFAIADEHELTEAQLSALREARPTSRSVPVMELARKLESRALQVIDQMLGSEPAAQPAGQAALSVRTDGYGLDALVSWLTPRVISDALPTPTRASTKAPGKTKAPASTASQPSQRARAATPASARVESQAPAATGKEPPHRAASRRESQPSAAAVVLPPPLLSWLRSDVSADLRFARAGMDAARASVLLSHSELSLRLRITHQAALDAAQWLSRKRRNELALWLLSKGAQLVFRKLVLPQLARIDVGPQFLLRVALAGGALGSASGSAPLSRLSLPVTRAAKRRR